MTALVVPPAQILGWTPTMLSYAHRRIVGTPNGYVWHRRRRTPICDRCRKAYNERQNRNRRSAEMTRLLKAGVNRDTAAYLAHALGIRQAAHAATVQAAAA